MSIYLSKPNEVRISDVRSKGLSFSPAQHHELEIINLNAMSLNDLLDRELRYSDKGKEVGSANYVSSSRYMFMRTKSLQPTSYIPLFTSDSLIPVSGKEFQSFNLKKGDVLISKDSNIGESVILEKDYPNVMVSGGIYRLPIARYKHYIFAFLKNDFFRTQLDLLTSKGATIRHAKTLFLDCLIPFPNQQDADDVIRYVETLVSSVISKEKEIRIRHEMIFREIKKELLHNQKPDEYRFEFPTIRKLNNSNRINAAYFDEYFVSREQEIKNYVHGYDSIYDLGFEMNRGQNLQVSAIGKSISSDTPRHNFYSLIYPKSLSEFGTVLETVYLGNPKALKTLRAGDIIFGAEGFEKGRSLVIFRDRDNTITNIHGITLNHSQQDIGLSIFVKCFLDYLRKIGMIDLYAVGGNGGSLAQKYWEFIPFPNFPSTKRKEIAELYYNPIDYEPDTQSDFEKFVYFDENWTKQAGIIQLDLVAKGMKKRIAEVIHQIVMDETVSVDFEGLV